MFDAPKISRHDCSCRDHAPGGALKLSRSRTSAAARVPCAPVKIGRASCRALSCRRNGEQGAGASEHGRRGSAPPPASISSEGRPQRAEHADRRADGDAVG
jgi:hypothetical protein